MANGKSCISIEEATLKDFSNDAKATIRSFTFIPRRLKPAAAKTGFMNPTAGIGSDRDLSEAIELAKLIGGFGGGDPDFPNDTAYDVIAAIMRAIKIGSQVSLQYIRASGLEQLKLDNDRGKLHPEKQLEFSAKVKTAAAIKIFTLAYYAAWKLGLIEKNDNAAKAVVIDIPSIDLANGIQSTNCILYYYAQLLADPAQTRTEQDILSNTIAYFKRVTEEIRQIAGSLEFCEPFTAVNYKLENEDFIISGFETDFTGSATTIEFNRVYFRDVMGNRTGKHLLRRWSQRTAAFKIKEQCNVFFELKLIQNVMMCYGSTGGGKSLMAAAAITDLYERCEKLGKPFIPLVMPNLVSHLQGKSGTQTHQYWDKFFNRSAIVLGLADDADSKFIDRNDDRASEGSIQVVEATLTRTEGVEAKWDGGRGFFYMCNNPDTMDPAILSRVVCKIPIDGAQSVHDYLDFNYKAQEFIRKIDPGFIGMTDPDDYAYLSDQANLASLSGAYVDYQEAREPIIREIVQRVKKAHDLNSQEFFAHLCYEVQQKFPAFNFRDQRNITDAIDARLGDFDLPEEWDNDPKIFDQQDYDRQKEMVLALMRTNMKGLSFAEISLQEAIRYFDGLANISQRVERREIECMAQQIRRQQAAMKLAAQAGN